MKEAEMGQKTLFEKWEMGGVGVQKVGTPEDKLTDEQRAAMQEYKELFGKWPRTTELKEYMERNKLEQNGKDS